MELIKMHSLWANIFLMDMRKTDLFILIEIHKHPENSFLLILTWIAEDKVKFYPVILTKFSSTNCLIVIHPEFGRVFLENLLIIFQAGRTAGASHGQINSPTFRIYDVNKPGCSNPILIIYLFSQMASMLTLVIYTH